MRNTGAYLLVIIMGLLAFMMESCKKDSPLEENTIEQNYLVIPNTTLCNYDTFDILGGTRGSQTVVGQMEIANDGNNLYIDITSNNTNFSNYQVFVGDCNAVRSDSSTTPQIIQFPLQGQLLNDSALITVPLSTLDNCFCVVARLAQPRGSDGGSGAGGTGTGISSSAIVDYCEIPCVPCNTNNIFGQGGWGAKPAGQNPATYLYANFATWFPNGITLGCTSGNTIKLSTAQNVTNFLPQGGTPRAISQSYVNPTTRITVLAGHLLTLTINVASNPSLGNQIISNGPFAGMTVNAFLAQANNFFGGCITGDASKYSSTLASISNQPSQIVSCN